jgi:hypothetical protein
MRDSLITICCGQSATGFRAEDPDLEELIPPDEKAELLLRYYAFCSREAEHAMAELEPSPAAGLK